MTIKMPTRSYVFLIFIILIVTTLVAYEPVRQNEFVDYDDTEYVTKNQNVVNGFTLKGIKWAFTTFHMGNWHPVTWLSHMLDCQLFGLNPLWHHLTSLLFHILNTLLLFWVFKRITGAVWCSAFVAAFFALHPVHVESVAWAAERKDVLSGFFFMLTIAAYVRYVEKPGFGRYTAVFLFLFLGLMSKPMLVTLPFILLLLDYWPLERFRYKRQKNQKGRDLFLEKIPLFVPVIGSSIITFIAQRVSGSVTSLENLPTISRMANAVVSYVKYLTKIFYPNRLAALYPYQNVAGWQVITCYIILVAVSLVVLYTARKRRYLTVGWLWYICILIPVIGLVQIGKQAMADRYTYLPSIGISIMVAWAAAEFAKRWRFTKFVFGVTGGLILVVLLLFTRIQVSHWQNSLTLFKHTVKVTENNYRMHNNYGAILKRQGDIKKAIEQFKITIDINPDYIKAYNNLGSSYFVQNKPEQAVFYWRQALGLDPEYANALNNIAWISAVSADERFFNPDKAIEFSQRACKLTEYKRADYLDTLGVAYAAAGRFNEAISITEKALQTAEEEDEELVEEIYSRLQLYKDGKRYHE